MPRILFFLSLATVLGLSAGESRRREHMSARTQQTREDEQARENTQADKRSEY
jgi:hypothetical protein